MWPCGSSGAPHSGHGGRPEATTRPARATNDRAASRLIRTRSRSGPSSSSSSSSSGSMASPSSDWARASTRHATGASVPAERQRSRAEGFVERLVQRAAVVGRCRIRELRLGDPAPLELGHELAEPLGQHGHLDLLHHDTDHARAVPCLEEEGPVARLADGPGHEPLGRIEEIASSRHARTLYRLARIPRPRARSRQATWMETGIPAAGAIGCRRRARTRSGPRPCRRWPGP